MKRIITFVLLAFLATTLSGCNLEDVDSDFEVSFNTNEGSKIDRVTVIAGGLVSRPEDPVREGYLFVKWSDNHLDYLPDEFDFKTPINKHTTLYAKWTTIDINVSFETNSLETVDTIIVNIENELILPYLAIKEGYTFVGWFVDSELTRYFNGSDMPSEDFTLYAKWQEELVLFNWGTNNFPVSINPTFIDNIGEQDIVNQLFEGLVRDIDGIIYPGVAESWDTSEDGLTVTFHLRESNWSDGTSLTAHDFVYSWFLTLDQNYFSPSAWMWEDTNIVGAVDALYYGGSLDDVGITAIDDYTLEVQLTRPTNYFVSMMSHYFYYPIKEGTDYSSWIGTNPSLIVSNGPFNYKGVIMSDIIELEKNPEYWNKSIVGIDIIHIYILTNAELSYSMYLEGKLDYISQFPVEENENLIENSDEFYIIPMLGTYYYSFNMDKDGDGVNEGFEEDGIWANNKLRLALSYSINRQEIVLMLGAGQMTAIGLIPPGMYDDQGIDFYLTSLGLGVYEDDTNYALAQTLFAEASAEMGMTVEELQLAIEGEEILFNNSTGHYQVAELIQAMWELNLGFTITLKEEEFAVYIDYRMDEYYDIIKFGWLSDFSDPYGILKLFQSNDSYNISNFYNEEYDSYIEAALSSTSIEEYYGYLYAAQEILYEEMPIIPIFHYTNTFLIDDSFEGWGMSANGVIDFSRTSKTE